MKKVYTFLLIVLFTSISNSQERLPTTVSVRDVDNKTVLTRSFYNSGKPIIIEFWGTYCVPCIDLLNSFKPVYKEWQKETGVKIIVISTEPKSKRKKALKMIKENKWPFEFYFDYNKTLFNKLTQVNVVPQTFIYDGNLQLVEKFRGSKPNFGFRIKKNGERGEKVKINRGGKYDHLDCDLTQYEKVLFSIKKKK
ncbi:MAG: TlpA family protein disulfide reductase [Flavobacteriaceae bacterium]|nr:TlpA family protein disulfide reductase [Flavobacteriaceae bacterium]